MGAPLAHIHSPEWKPLSGSQDPGPTEAQERMSVRTCSPSRCPDLREFGAETSPSAGSESFPGSPWNRKGEAGVLLEAEAGPEEKQGAVVYPVAAVYKGSRLHGCPLLLLA